MIKLLTVLAYSGVILSAYGSANEEEICSHKHIDVHPYACSNFFLCSEEFVISYQCPGNSLFNPTTLSCAAAESVVCNSILDTYTLPDNANFLHGSTPIVTNSSICQFMEMGDLLPNPDDCSQFFQCSQYGAVLFQCPSTLYFNPIWGACDWPYKTECYVNELATVTPPITTTMTEEITTTYPASNCILDDRCPLCSFELNPTLLAHPSRCEAYLQCEKGYACEKECPTGLHWSRALNRCERVNVANCVPSVRPACVDDECLPDDRCPMFDDPLKLTLISIPGICDKYLQCNYGQACVASCFPGLHWSVLTQQCEWPNVANCISGDPGKCAADYRCPVFDDPNFPTLLPHPDRCDSYLKCANGQSCEVACPPGLHWSAVRNCCDWPENANCGLPVTTPNPNEPCLPGVTCPGPSTCTPDNRCPINEDPKFPTHLPHSNRCDKFYKCSAGNACEMDCPSGLHWSVIHNRCEWPFNAQCVPVITTTQTSGDPGRTNCIPDSRCPLGENPSYATHLPHAGNCSKFFKCLFGQACELECPSGLHWSTAQNRCEWQHIAQCSQLQ